MRQGRTLLARELAIDMGTVTTRVYTAGKGVVFNGPSILAIDSKAEDVVAIGHEAVEVIGKVSGYVEAVKPLKHGVISDLGTAEKMLKTLFKIVGVSRFTKPKLVLTVASNSTMVERRALREIGRRAGAGEVYLLDKSLAAALGAGIVFSEPFGSMVVDMGGGSTSAAILATGGVVNAQTAHVGGVDLDEAVQSYLRQEYGLAIADQTAEQIKLAIGAARPLVQEPRAEVVGRDTLTGAARTVVLSATEVRHAWQEQLSAIIGTAVRCLAEAPPELGQDVLVNGVCLLGGGAQLPGMKEAMEEAVSVPVRLAEHPAESIITGAGRFLEEFNSLKGLLSSV
jgi:cell shape determining protein, MreB/Mrl family